jgi:hypothetical protein
MVDQVRTAASANFTFAGPRFRTQVEAALRRRAGSGKPGRPKGRSDPGAVDLR